MQRQDSWLDGHRDDPHEGEVGMSDRCRGQVIDSGGLLPGVNASLGAIRRANARGRGEDGWFGSDGPSVFDCW
jgi:hypothetical protein